MDCCKLNVFLLCMTVEFLLKFSHIIKIYFILFISGVGVCLFVPSNQY